MALTLGTLLEETQETYHLQLIAGSNGLYHTPLWLYFSESIENLEFLKGGELILITGLGSMGPDWLYQYVQAIHAANASGLIINTGKYILQEDISKDVLGFCNAHQFPLLTMPWEMHLADITQDMCRRIFESSHQYDDINHILMALVSGDKLRRRDAAMLESSEYSLYGDYLIAVFTLPDKTLSERLLSLFIEEYIAKTCETCTYFFFQGFHVLLFHEMPNEEIQKHVKAISSSMKSTFHLTALTCGAGCHIHGIEHLAESFQTALEAHHYAHKRQLAFLFFDQLGVDKLFYSLPDKSTLTPFCHCLEPLILYDKEHSSELLKTLYLYLNQNKSIQMTADTLFCHRNTINYRMNQIKSLLDNDLNNPQFIFEIQLAFHILDYTGEFSLPLYP